MQPSLRVLGIVGSPRKGGNTDLLVSDVLEGCRSLGADTDKLCLADYQIGPCKGCLTCYPNGRERCVANDDDMPSITRRMQRADVWVLGTPVYCYGPTGVFKTFLDRWICFLPEVYEDTAVASVIPLHLTAARAEPALGMLKMAYRSFGLTDLGELVASGLLHMSDLDQQRAYRTQAKTMGRSLLAARSVPSCRVCP